MESLPSASKSGTSGVETRIVKVVGAAPMAVVAVVGEAPAELELAPGAQAAMAITLAAIPMTTAAR